MRKKLKLLALLPMMLLTSCNEITPYGSYSFSLGRVGDTKNRIAITMKLSDENYFDVQDPTIRLGNKFNLSFQFPAEGDLGIIGQLLQNLEGYYKVTDIKNEKLGYRVILGAEIAFGASKISIPPTALEHLCVCYLDDRNFSINIPVSIDDAKYQLAWYGLYFDIKDDGTFVYENLADKVGGEKNLPGQYHGEERFGTHPTADNVTTMNTMFADVFSNTHFYIESTTIAGTYDEYASVYRTNSDIEGEYRYYFAPKDVKELSESQKTCYYRVWNSESSSYDFKKIQFDLFEPRPEAVVPNALITKMYDPTQPTEKQRIDEKKFFSDYFENPFVFRDFHTLNIGLIKDSN